MLKTVNKTFNSRESISTTPTKVQKNKSSVRVSTAAKLMALNWNTNAHEKIKGSSVMGCQRWRNHSAANQDIAEIEVQGGRAMMKNHFYCNSSWSCDFCALRKEERMRSWLRAALIPALEIAGLSASLATFTLQHNYGDDWGHNVNILLMAFSLVDKKLFRHYEKVGSLGKIRALEVTIGKNGLHPHLHVEITHTKNVDLTDLILAMKSAWKEAVIKLGGKVGKTGFDFKKNCINDYFLKKETCCQLTTHQGTKVIQSKGSTIWDLLDHAHAGCHIAALQWLRAQKALGGHVRFHAGNLPKKLGIVSPTHWIDGELKAAKDLAKSKLPPATTIAYKQIKHLKATDPVSSYSGLAMILRAARTGEADKVNEIVDLLCHDVEVTRNKYEKYLVPELRTAENKDVSPYRVAKARQAW